MNSLIVMCLCVAYVSSQVVVPPLSPENQRATDEHLAAVARATQNHFEAHRNNAADEGRHHQQAFAHQQPFNHFNQHQAFAPQQNAFAHQSPLGFNPHFNPHTFGQNRFF